MIAEAKRGKNTNLAACIKALDICRRVFFGIAVVLSQLESIIKAH